MEASHSCIFGEVDDMAVDVMCQGKHYTSLNEFAEYIMEDV